MARSNENNRTDVDRFGMTNNTPAARSSGKKKSGRKAVSRKRAAFLSRGYVFFLAIMCIATVLMCIRYLRLKETITTQVKQNNALQTELKAMRDENDALMESIENSVDMNHIRDVAINKFGMKYATEDQVIWYNGEDTGYVEQYREVS